jgi:hypothetical protein
MRIGAAEAGSAGHPAIECGDRVAFDEGGIYVVPDEARAG